MTPALSLRDILLRRQQYLRILRSNKRLALVPHWKLLCRNPNERFRFRYRLKAVEDVIDGTVIWK